jgi:hypothetical protein
MATTAAAVAAAAARARREVRGHFEEHGAFDPEHAVSYDPPRRLQRTQLDRLIGRGIVKRTMDGRLWLDRAAYRLEEERRAAMAKRMMLFIAAVFGVTLALAAIAALSH